LVVTAPPTISNAFNPAVIQTGGASTLVFTLVNSDTIPLTSAAFTDALNAAIAVAGSGTVAAGGTCPGAPAYSSTAAASAARLTVAAAPSISEAFSTNPIAQGATTSLTFTLTSTSNVALTGATFTDALANMQIATAGAATGTCVGAGTNSFAAGDTGTLTLS